LSQVDDIVVIGGGINGCGIVRDAAGRGYSARLAEMNDLASGRSSWSSKFIHGSFRYDVVCRSTKLGIQLNKKRISAFVDWMQQKIVSDMCSEELRSQNC
jgi:glycerol-3-phosphate dehydrogenase